MTSTGLVLLSPASDSRRWCWPSRLSTELHPSTWLRSSTSAGRLVPPLLRANKARSAKSLLFCDELPSNVRTAESLSMLGKYSRLIYSDFTSTTIALLPPNPPPLTIVSIFSFTPSMVICRGFSLVTKVCIISHIGQKRLLNALNVNVNVNPQ